MKAFVKVGDKFTSTGRGIMTILSVNSRYVQYSYSFFAADQKHTMTYNDFCAKFSGLLVEVC